MSISPFSARPTSPEGERRRARLVVLIATLGIAATLLAYAVSPGVRHAVGHAAHSVKKAVSHVLDRDKNHAAKKAQPANRTPAGTAPRHAPATTTSRHTTGSTAPGAGTVAPGGARAVAAVP